MRTPHCKRASHNFVQTSHWKAAQKHPLRRPINKQHAQPTPSARATCSDHKTCSPPQPTSELQRIPLLLDLPKLSCSLMMLNAKAPRVLAISLGVEWMTPRPDSFQRCMRLNGFIAMQPNCTAGGQPKDVHSELVVHCKDNGG